MRTFTTGELAKICGVSCRTAAKWIDTGLLTGFKIPGSPARRVKEEVLIAFAKKHELPIDLAEDGSVK